MDESGYQRFQDPQTESIHVSVDSQNPVVMEEKTSIVSREIPVKLEEIIKYYDIANSWFINRYLWKIATEDSQQYMVLRCLIEHYIKESFVEKIHKEIKERFPCKCEQVGSSFEGTQAGVPDEYDFLFELSDLGCLCDNIKNVRIDKVDVLSTKPQEEGVLKPQTFINLWYNRAPIEPKITRGTYVENDNILPDSNTDILNGNPWKDLGRDENSFILDPKKIHLLLREQIEQALEKTYPRLKIWENEKIVVKCRGPAVRAQNLQIPETGLRYIEVLLSSLPHRTVVIKIDFVLAIPVNVLQSTTTEGHGLILKPKWTTEVTWSLPNMKLTEYGRDVSTWHLVLSWNYWQLSCGIYDSQFVKEQCGGSAFHEVKQACYLAMKQLRNMQDITDDYETGLLPSYPLKVTFIKECLNNKDEWKKNNISSQVFGILKKVHEDKGKCKLSCPFVKDHPVLSLADRTYLEAKRTILHLENVNQWYKKRVRINTAMVILYMLGISILSVTGMRFFSSSSAAVSSLSMGVLLLESFLLEVIFIGTLAAVILDSMTFWCSRTSRKDPKYQLMIPLYIARIFNFSSSLVLELLYLGALFNPTVPMLYMACLLLILICGWTYIIVSAIAHWLNKGCCRNEFRNRFICLYALGDIFLCNLFCCSRNKRMVNHTFPNEIAVI